MCGLVGVSGNLYDKDLSVFKTLLKLDTIRGEHSTGLASLAIKGLQPAIYKNAVNGFDFLKEKAAKELITTTKVLLMGHNRHATKGAINSENAHPFRCGRITGVHNGTLSANYKELLPSGGTFETDSEAIFNSIEEKGIEWTLARLHGAYALIWHDAEEGTLNFIRNNQRPLHYGWSKSGQTLWWSSDGEVFDLARSNENVHGNLEQKGDYMYPFFENTLYVSKVLPDFSKTLCDINRTSKKGPDTPFMSITNMSHITKVYPKTTKHYRSVGSHFPTRATPKQDKTLVLPYDQWDTKTKTSLSQDLEVLRDKKKKEDRAKAAREAKKKVPNQEEIELSKAYGYHKAGDKKGAVVPMRAGPFREPTSNKERNKALVKIESLYKRFHVRSAARWLSDDYTHHLAEEIPDTWVIYNSLKKEATEKREEAEALYEMYKDSLDLRNHELVISRLKRAEYCGDLVAFTLESSLTGGFKAENSLSDWEFSIENSIEEMESPALIRDVKNRDYEEEWYSAPSGFKKMTNKEYEDFIVNKTCENCRSGIPLSEKPEKIIPLTCGGVIGTCCSDKTEVKDYFGSGVITRESQSA